MKTTEQDRFERAHRWANRLNVASLFFMVLSVVFSFSFLSWASLVAFVFLQIAQVCLACWAFTHFHNERPTRHTL